MTAPFESESYCRVVEPRVVFKHYMCPKCRMGAVEEIKYGINTTLSLYQLKCNRCGIASDIHKSYAAARWDFGKKTGAKK